MTPNWLPPWSAKPSRSPTDSLRRVRVAQFQKGMVRVVLEVDDVSDYSAFLLPNPYRLIIDIHGRKPNAPQTMVARAQQEGEKRVPSPTQPQETKPEDSTAPAPVRRLTPSRRPLSRMPRLLASRTASDQASCRVRPENGRWQLLLASFCSRRERFTPTPPRTCHLRESSTAADCCARRTAPRPAIHPGVHPIRSRQSQRPELKATDKPTSAAHRAGGRTARPG